MNNDDKIQLKWRLLGSLLDFTRVFYKERTGREFIVSRPVSREPHQITVCRELTDVLRLKTRLLMINMPPGHGKSELCIHFVAWAMARYPDSAWIYLSYSHELASQHTFTIKNIINLPLYKEVFSVSLRSDSSAKDAFRTEQGGAVKAFGSSGAVTGQDAGLPILDRFSGAVIMDDMHKPDEVHSDVVRERVITNYSQTIKQRRRSDITPFIYIGQRLHEADLPAFLLDGKDGYEWKSVILPAIDVAGNVLDERIISKASLLREAQYNEYAYASQYQQTPQPAGGGIFKRDNFIYLDEEPEILKTFITCDTAETDKSWNDATVFSFWGIYQIVENNVPIPDLYGLHWLDCWELRCEPKDLETNFNQFYMECMQHPVKPLVAAIEKKSTGVTLSSVLKSKRGLTILDLDRNIASGSKSTRFLSIQRYVSAKLISFPYKAKHGQLCIDHMAKITPNGTHRHDDIADTCYDAIKLALIDKVLLVDLLAKTPKLVQNSLIEQQKRMIMLKDKAFYGKIS